MQTSVTHTKKETRTQQWCDGRCFITWRMGMNRYRVTIRDHFANPGQEYSQNRQRLSYRKLYHETTYLILSAVHPYGVKLCHLKRPEVRYIIATTCFFDVLGSPVPPVQNGLVVRCPFGHVRYSSTFYIWPRPSEKLCCSNGRTVCRRRPVPQREPYHNF